MKGVRDAGREFLHDSEVEEAKLFKSGGSQAVRLPRAFRFDGDRVRIWREGDRVILEAVPSKRTPEETLAWLRGLQERWGPDPLELPDDAPPSDPPWASDPDWAKPWPGESDE